jgi:hypothetical protein
MMYQMPGNGQMYYNTAQAEMGKSHPFDGQQPLQPNYYSPGNNQGVAAEDPLNA